MLLWAFGGAMIAYMHLHLISPTISQLNIPLTGQINLPIVIKNERYTNLSTKKLVAPDILPSQGKTIKWAFARSNLQKSAGLQ